MNRQAKVRGKSSKLPAILRGLFWDYDFGALTWERDRELVIARVLASGSWRAVAWLRSRVSADELREWIERGHGGGLSPRQLRFWELVLDLPHRRVTEWLRSPRRSVWDQRAHP